MPDIFDEISLDTTREDIFDQISYEEPKRSLPQPVRMAGKGAAEFFGGRVGLIPSLAVMQHELQPALESIEEEARPEFLTSAGLEAAPEKAISNLLALLGASPIVQQLTPERLSERFKETTGGKFEPKTKTERIFARGAKLAGEAPGAALRFGAAGGAGQVLRELGAPNWIANSVEVLGALGPSPTKRVLPQSTEKKLVEFAREKGLTETEISAILNGEAKRDILSKLAFKGPRTRKIIKGVEEKAGDSFETVKEKARQFPHLSGEKTEQFAEQIGDLLSDLRETVHPSVEKQQMIDFVEKSYENIINKGITPYELVNYFQDINRTIPWNSIHGGKKRLAQIKGFIRSTLHDANPALAEEFDLVNDLYSRMKKISKALKPDMIDKIKILGPAGSLAAGIATFNLPLIQAGAGGIIGQVLARELLINPRLQGLQRKMVEAVNENSIPLANSVLQKIKAELKKKYPDDFSEINFEEISETPQRQTEEQLQLAS